MTVVPELPPSSQNANFFLRIQLLQLKEQVQLTGEKMMMMMTKVNSVGCLESTSSVSLLQNKMPTDKELLMLHFSILRISSVPPCGI